MADNPMMHSVSGRPVSAQSYLQPGGTTTAELRNQASPKRPNWGERTSSTNKDEVTSLGSNVPLTGPVDGMRTPPADGYARSSVNEPWDNDLRSLHGIDIDHQTHQAFNLYSPNSRRQPMGPIPINPVGENPIQVSEGAPGRDPENHRGAAPDRSCMSRRKKWILAGVGTTALAGLAIGLGVGLGTHSSSNPGSAGSGDSTGGTTSTTSPVAQPTTPAGPLVAGSYNTSAVLKEDTCFGALHLYCEAVPDRYTFTINDGTYIVTHDNGSSSVNAGAADSSGELKFSFPRGTVNRTDSPNNCSYNWTTSIDFNLSTYSFSGTDTAIITNPVECLDNYNFTIHAGDSCNCTSSVLGSYIT